MESPSEFVRALTFIQVLYGVIISWILAISWQRTFHNLVYGTLGLDPTSTYHSFIVSLVITAIFITIYFSYDNITGNIVESVTLGVNPDDLVPGNTGSSNTITVSSSDNTVISNNRSIRELDCPDENCKPQSYADYFI